jgi:hypothetical protein
MTNRWKITSLTAAVAALLLGSIMAPTHGMAGSDGISALLAVTQQKAGNANNDAMNGADKQRALVGKEQSLHASQQKFEEFSHHPNDHTQRSDRTSLQRFQRCETC